MACPHFTRVRRPAAASGWRRRPTRLQSSTYLRHASVLSHVAQLLDTLRAVSNVERSPPAVGERPLRVLTGEPTSPKLRSPGVPVPHTERSSVTSAQDQGVTDPPDMPPLACASLPPAFSSTRESGHPSYRTQRVPVRWGRAACKGREESPRRWARHVRLNHSRSVPQRVLLLGLPALRR